jgi:hypothetical protein
VARPPSVFVRELSPGEGAQLRQLSRRHKQFAIRQRAQILLASATPSPLSARAEIEGCDLIGPSLELRGAEL